MASLRESGESRSSNSNSNDEEEEYSLELEGGGGSESSGSIYIVPLSSDADDDDDDERQNCSRQMTHPSSASSSSSSSSRSAFTDEDERSMELLEITAAAASSSSAVAHGSDDHTLSSIQDSSDEDNDDDAFDYEDNSLSDVENAIETFPAGNKEDKGESNTRNTRNKNNTQAEAAIDRETRAISVLKYLIGATHVCTLIVSLSAAITSTVVNTNTNTMYLHIALLLVLFTISVILFCVREIRMDKRQLTILNTAAKSSAIVDSLFPAVVRDRLFGSSNTKHHDEQMSRISKTTSLRLSSHRIFPMTPKRRLEKYLSNTTASNQAHPETYMEEPIAEMFHDTTIMFGDIVGFTAWSSEREPPQVFKLLETLYRAFDKVARKLKVFKVETIGDCYVAVAGLPEPRCDHAIVMARFAWECQKQMGHLTKRLEISLGPGTSDLALRIGLHSGSVTAGVLRGEKSRFQLFGDTMNTASRLESTSSSGKIHVSQSTADLISSGGKPHWLTPRDDLVFAKGKGSMETWWVQPQKSKSRSQQQLSKSHLSQCLSISEGALQTAHWGTLSFSNTNVVSEVVLSDKEDRLVDWCTEILSQSLAGVVSARMPKQEKQQRKGSMRRKSQTKPVAMLAEASHSHHIHDEQITYPEVSESVELPKFDRDKIESIKNDPSVLSPKVREQLRDFVANIATRYHDHQFHNFEHASHVLLSANKLMKRIISPDSIDTSLNPDKIDLEDLHNSSFGISSDPLTQFTIIFSALIHDVEHTGVPNTVLVAEENELALKYDNKSVAEHNSVEIALSLLSRPRFQELQTAIHSTAAERDLFHQLLVNTVLATDIVDQDVTKSREDRWRKAFSSSSDSAFDNSFDHGRATVVIEHIIQASDVAHTMQHWHVFCRWNEKLFMENYQSFKSKRREGSITSMDWYTMEISFFDDYVIPLAKKLKESGVFGVSSDEYLNYALANRDEWISKGNEIACQLVAKAEAKFAEDAKFNAVFVSPFGRAA